MTGNSLRVSFVGAGTIAGRVFEQLGRHPSVRIAAVVRSAAASFAEGARWQGVPVARTVFEHGTDLVVEMAGAAAVAEHVVPALRHGIPCVICSVGALSDAEVLAAVEQAAIEGGTRVKLIAGAVGAIDALSAAALGGLESVHYTGRKPPLAWRDTPAADRWPLASLQSEQVVFEGSAREAALRFPKNANVAAIIGLAGAGLDETGVTLIADPAVDQNTHRIVATGAFGRMEFAIRNVPSAENPKTSEMTAYSVARAVLDEVGALRF